MIIKRFFLVATLILIVIYRSNSIAYADENISMEKSEIVKLNIIIDILKNQRAVHRFANPSTGGVECKKIFHDLLAWNGLVPLEPQAILNKMPNHASEYPIPWGRCKNSEAHGNEERARVLFDSSGDSLGAPPYRLYKINQMSKINKKFVYVVYGEPNPDTGVGGNYKSVDLGRCEFNGALVAEHPQSVDELHGQSESSLVLYKGHALAAVSIIQGSRLNFHYIDSKNQKVCSWNLR